MPTKDLKLNKYGNIPVSGPHPTAAQSQEHLSGTIGGVSGIWQRPTKGKRGGYGTTGPTGLKLLRLRQPHNTDRFDFYGIAKRVVPKIVGKEMDRHCRALASKR